MTVFHLAAIEFKILCKDRATLALLFLMPMLLIFLLTLALTDIYLQKTGMDLKILLLTDENPQIIERMARTGFNITSRKNDASIHLDEIVSSGQYDAVIRIKSNIQQTIMSADNSEKIDIAYRPLLDHSLKVNIEQQFLATLNSLMMEQINQYLKKEAQLKSTEAIQLRDLSQNSAIINVVPSKFAIPNPIQLTVPAWAIFAMFFIFMPISASFNRDFYNQVFVRLSMFNVPKSHMIIGKLLAYFVINLIQFWAMFGVGKYIMPVVVGINFSFAAISFKLLFISVLISFVSTSFGLLLSSLSNNQAKASSVGAISVLVLALLGGVMIPHFAMPVILQKISVISPIYWGLDTILQIMTQDMEWSALLFPAFILMSFTLFCLGIAIKYLQWEK